MSGLSAIRSKFLLLLMCFALARTYEIEGIQAGSVQFEDKLIRLNTCMSKKVELKLTKQYYDSHKDIEAIVTISALKMDDQLTFYIYYNLACNKKFCELQINVQRYTPKVSELFEYGLRIDYLIAHGLKTVAFNMTYYSQHFQIPPFQEDMELDQWTAILIPNGFSDLKLLGKVSSEIMPNYDFLKLSYFDGESSSSASQSSWSLNQKFILYKIVFLPKTYLQNTSKQEEFTSFFGFKSSRKPQINSYLQLSNLQGFGSSQEQGQYLSIPVRKTAIFNDNRKLPVGQISESIKPAAAVESGSKIQRFLFGAVCLVILQIAYLIYKKKIIEKRKELNQTVVFPQLIVSFDGHSKSAPMHLQLRETESNLETYKTIKMSAELKA